MIHNNIAKLHPEMSESVELSILLRKLPDSLQGLAGRIQDHVKDMSPAGLTVFMNAFREELAIILESRGNGFEQRITHILHGDAANDDICPQESFKEAA